MASCSEAATEDMTSQKVPPLRIKFASGTPSETEATTSPLSSSLETNGKVNTLSVTTREVGNEASNDEHNPKNENSDTKLHGGQVEVHNPLESKESSRTSGGHGCQTACEISTPVHQGSGQSDLECTSSDVEMSSHPGNDSVSDHNTNTHSKANSKTSTVSQSTQDPALPSGSSSRHSETNSENVRESSKVILLDLFMIANYR